MADEPVVWIEAESSDMARAIMAAQSTFPEFARHAELEHFRIVPAFGLVAIKAFFPDPARLTRGEHMFVTDIFTNGRSVTGTLASDPSDLPGLAAGQEVTFPIANVSDWFLVLGRRGIGGFTTDVLKKHMTAAERAGFESQEPLVWYQHRGEDGASAELAAAPVCTACGMPDLVARAHRTGACELCAGGGVRCDCSGCGAPLFRYPDAPRECHHCLVTSRK